MLKFLFYFTFLIVVIVGMGLVVWFVVHTLSRFLGRNRGKRSHPKRRRAGAAAWLPIATFQDQAPGAVQTLLWADGEARLGVYDERSACWRGQADGDRGDPLHPTHWMPLPRPPMS